MRADGDKPNANPMRACPRAMEDFAQSRVIDDHNKKPPQSEKRYPDFEDNQIC
jgi:hypothetical protein